MTKTTREIMRDMRKTAGLSQAKFAKKYNIPLSTIESWEMGKKNPTPYTLTLLAFRVAYDTGESGAELLALMYNILGEEEE